MILPMILPKRTKNSSDMGPTYGDLQYDAVRQAQINAIWWFGLKVLAVIVGITAGVVYIFS